MAAKIRIFRIFGLTLTLNKSVSYGNEETRLRGNPEGFDRNRRQERPPIVVAVTLWLVTIWIPYLNIGTTIAFITFVVMFVLFVLAASIAMAIEASFWKQLKDNVE